MRGWLFIGLSFALEIVSLSVMALRAPEMLNQRGTQHHGVKSFDRVFAAMWLLASVASAVATGLDWQHGWSRAIAAQCGLSAYSGGACDAGIAVLFLAFGLGLWAMLANPHFEQFVRIQTDRLHGVVASGPYRIVRHPGYVAAILGNIAAPLILGSWLAAMAAAVVIALFWVRTLLEDRTLMAELADYADYARVTRYRLLPCVW